MYSLKTVIAKRPTKTVYRDGDKVIKLFNEGYSKADILNEALNQARVEETDLLIPKIHAVTQIDGKWAIVLDYIEGPTLADLMAKHPEKRDEYMKRFVELQLAMHQQQVPLLNKLKDKMNRKISATKFDATTRYELHTRLEAMHKHTKLLHGDFNPSNIIVASDGDYIIDWAHATQGNASADAARTYLLFSLDGETDNAEAYLNTFCALSDTAKQYVQKWIPIVAASQTVKQLSGQMELLKKWVNVFDYE